MSSDVTKEINKLSNLPQYKNYSKQELEKLAKSNLIVKEFEKSDIFAYDGKEEKVKKQLDIDKNFVIDRFKSYLKDYKLDSTSDLDTLKSLVFVELTERRVQRELNDLAIKRQIPSKNVTEQLISLQKQKSDLKLKLGIDKNKEQDSELAQLEKLEIRFQRHIEENRNEFTLDAPMICEKCNHEAKYMYLLRRRVKDFDAIKHPWYAGRFFFNYEMFKDVKDGKLDKEDAWRYMCSCSLGKEFQQTAFSKKHCFDYIDWCLKNWGLITSMLDKK